MGAEGKYIIEDDIDNWGVAVSATNTFAITDVNKVDDKITVGLDVPTGSKIRFSSTKVLPGGLSVGVIYYAIRVDATIIQVASTPINAAAETPVVDLTDVGVGTHTIDVSEGESLTDRQAVIDRVEALVEKITYDYFYSKVFDILRSGNGRNRLYLGLKPQVLTVTTIKVKGVEIPSTEWTYDESFVFISPTPSYPSELLRREEKLFPKGFNNVEIIGTMGYVNCPNAIKQACIILVRDENDSTLYEHYEFNKESMGRVYSYDRGKAEYLSGIIECDKYLRRYVNRRPVMSAT
jgi:hypothetical protein